MIVYAFDGAPETSVSEALQLADRLQLIRGEEHPDLWISWSGFHEIEPALADALAAAKLRSGPAADGAAAAGPVAADHLARRLFLRNLSSRCAHQADVMRASPTETGIPA